MGRAAGWLAAVAAARRKDSCRPFKSSLIPRPSMYTTLPQQLLNRIRGELMKPHLHLLGVMVVAVATASAQPGADSTLRDEVVHITQGPFRSWYAPMDRHVTEGQEKTS